MRARYSPADFESLSDCFYLCPAQIHWAVDCEMAQTLEDVLARRTPCLFLDVEESLRLAPRVARLMAQNLGHPPDWVEEQLQAFQQTAQYFRLPQQ